MIRVIRWFAPLLLSASLLAGCSATSAEPAPVVSAAPQSSSAAGSAPRRIVGPSATSLAYARKLGGVPQDGRILYLVIGDSVGSESEAQRLLDQATRKFGDMQSYFIIQRSENFTGLRPGWWVLVEVHSASPSSENIDFAKRGFGDCYVKRAVVHTGDPIPVYADLVPK